MSSATGEIFVTFFMPALALLAAYVIVGEFILVYQRRILLAAAYVTMLGSLAATAALIGRKYGLGMEVLFGGIVAGLFISLPAVLLAKLMGRVQSLEEKVHALAAAPNQGPAPDSQRASASPAGEA
jgi:hypothetical protein